MTWGSMTKARGDKNQVAPEASLRELDSASCRFRIRSAADARVKLAAKYWAQLGRLMNVLAQQPSRKRVQEVRELIMRFDEIPDKPFDVSHQIKELQECLVAIEDGLVQHD